MAKGNYGVNSLGGSNLSGTVKSNGLGGKGISNITSTMKHDGFPKVFEQSGKSKAKDISEITVKDTSLSDDVFTSFRRKN